jgi:hypothetical protein
MWFGVMAMAYSLLFTNVVSQIINSWPNKKLLGYSYLEQLKDILPYIVLSLAACMVTIPIEMLKLHTSVILILQIICVGVAYVLLSKIFGIDAYEYILDSAKSYIKRK